MAKIGCLDVIFFAGINANTCVFYTYYAYSQRLFYFYILRIGVLFTLIKTIRTTILVY